MSEISLEKITFFPKTKTIEKSIAEADPEGKTPQTPQINSIGNRISHFMFWLYFVALILYPCVYSLIECWDQEAIIISYSVKEKASSFNFNQRALCTLNFKTHTFAFCKSYDVVDVIDLAWAIAPLYTCRGDHDESLYDLHKNFITYLDAYGIPSIQIEAVKKGTNQKYQIARANMEPYEIQSHIHNCSYLRENLLNVAIRKLDKPWEYMMWIDAHQVFEDPLWIYKGIVLAEKYAAVQLYKMSRRLDSTNTSVKTRQGFISSTIVGRILTFNSFEFGNAYILRRELYEKIGHILDECIANDCDVTYGKAAYPEFVWEYDIQFPKYTQSLSGWLNNTRKIFNGSRAYLTSDIYHFNHQTGAFPWEDLHRVLEWTNFTIPRDIRRNEDFTIYIENDMIAQLMESAIESAQ